VQRALEQNLDLAAAFARVLSLAKMMIACEINSLRRRSVTLLKA
jgi:hypothetical protein